MIASKKKLASWMLVAVAFSTTAAACGDDDDTKTTTTVAGNVDATTGEASGDSGSGSDASGNPDVVAFCKSAEELGAEYKKVMADPTSGDINALTAAATELTTQAATLSSASPADAQVISDCLTAMSTAMAGG